MRELKQIPKVIGCGRKPISLSTRQFVWDFWHASSIESSDTQRPAKLRKTSWAKLQATLQFPSSVQIISQRNKEFYQSMWRLTILTVYYMRSI